MLARSLPRGRPAYPVSGGGGNFLSWDAVTGATGYAVYWDTTPGPPYANRVDVGNVTSLASSSSLPGIGTGLRYFNVRSYDESLLEGPYGAELSKTV